MKIRIFLVLIILSACTSIPRLVLEPTRDVKSFLASLPAEERLFLEYFFRSLIQEDSVGYVLLGGKPMCFDSYLQPKMIISSNYFEPLDQLDFFFDGFEEREEFFRRGWEIWKKYEHHFCGKNIFFESLEQDSGLHFTYVFVVNKRLMLPLFDRYFHRFTSLDSSLKDKESLFEAFLHDQKFKEKFFTRQDLMGICLGYGERNALLFQKMIKLFTSMGWLDFTLERPSPSRLKALEEEWSILKSFFKVGIKDHVSRKFLFHFGVGFRADFSDAETHALQEKYTAYHKKITQAYAGSNFLERTLELIKAADG